MKNPINPIKTLKPQDLPYFNRHALPIIKLKNTRVVGELPTCRHRLYSYLSLFVIWDGPAGGPTRWWRLQSFQFSDLIILDSGQVAMDLELDLQYVRQLQAASLAEAQRGLEDTDAPPYAPTAGGPETAAVSCMNTTGRCKTEVICFHIALFTTSSGNSVCLSCCVTLRR